MSLEDEIAEIIHTYTDATDLAKLSKNMSDLMGVGTVAPTADELTQWLSAVAGGLQSAVIRIAQEIDRLNAEIERIRNR